MEYKNRHWRRLLSAIALALQPIALIMVIVIEPSSPKKIVDIAAGAFLEIFFAMNCLDWFRFKLRLTESGIDVRPGFSIKSFPWDSIYSIDAEMLRGDGSLYGVYICCFSKFSPSRIVLNKEETAEVLKEMAKHVPPEKWKSKGLEILKTM
jgi:hypothetical protein